MDPSINPFTITVDDTQQDVTAKSTGAWTSWETITKRVTLNGRRALHLAPPLNVLTTFDPLALGANGIEDSGVDTLP